MKAKMLLLVLCALFVIEAAVVIAAPTGPDQLGVLTSGQRIESSGSIPVQAEAGNVTMLNINDTRQTIHWQGYYGNVSGSVVLDDALNRTMYHWNMIPTGEVFASNSSAVTWANIYCVNFSGNGSGYQTYNESFLESYYNISLTDGDGLRETFNTTYASSTGFRIGTETINNQDACSMTYTNVNELYQTTDFQEFMLTDNLSIVFATIIEPSATGYDGAPYDFQMMVPVNYAADPMSYYFYVELE